MKQFLHRKATLSKVLLVIRHTAASTGQLRADSEARSSKNCQSSGSAIGPGEVCSRADGLRACTAGHRWLTALKYHEQRQQPDLPTPTQQSQEHLNCLLRRNFKPTDRKLQPWLANHRSFCALARIKIFKTLSTK